MGRHKNEWPEASPAHLTFDARWKAAIAIMAQPLHLIGDEAGPSESSGLAEEIELEGERNRFEVLTAMALEGVSQEDLTWLCTDGIYITDRLTAVWWAALRYIRHSQIARSGLSFRGFFDRSVDDLMCTDVFNPRILSRLKGKSESDWITGRRKEARDMYAQQRRDIMFYAKGVWK